MSNDVKLSVRSVSSHTQERLRALKAYSRLTYGALLDDSVEALWNEYLNEGHDIGEPASVD